MALSGSTGNNSGGNRNGNAQNVQLFSETEDFLRNPRDLMNAKDAEIIEKHSSIANKRQRTNQVVGNLLLKTSQNYDLLNSYEKTFCE